MYLGNKIKLFALSLIFLSACSSNSPSVSAEKSEANNEGNAVSTESDGVGADRTPSAICGTTKCQRILQLQKSLKEKKDAFDALPDSMKPNHQVPTEEWPQPSRQEIALDRVRGEISAFVCDYSVANSNKAENQLFIRFIVDISNYIGTGSMVSDLYSCFDSLYKKNQRALEPIVQSLGVSSKILQIIEEGKAQNGGDIQ